YQYFYPNGQMQTQGWYKNSLRHGEWRYYYIDGTLDGTRFYHKDQLHGIQQNFRVDGNIESYTIYKYGKAIEEGYYNTDKVAYESFNFKKAEKNYTLKTHYQNGQLQTEIAYINGIQHGPYK